MGEFYIRKFGRAGDVDAACDITPISSGDYEFPAVAFETQIVGLANDIPSSDGVHSCVIQGLDINGAEITEVATLNGATPVTLSNSYYRVNRAYIDAVGAALINSGNIDVTHTGSATLARIPPLEGQTLQAVYTLPAGVTAHVVGWNVEAAREATQVDVQAAFRFQSREAGKGWRTRDVGLAGNTQNFIRNYEHGAGITLKPMTDVRLRATAVNTDNVVITAGFEAHGFRDIR